MVVFQFLNFCTYIFYFCYMQMLLCAYSSNCTNNSSQLTYIILLLSWSVVFIRILHNMESKKIRIIFLYEFKLGHSAAEATRNINTAYDESQVSKRTMRRWFEKFCSEDTNLDNLSCGHAPFVCRQFHFKGLDWS